ncbi:MAG: carboxypeptidase regulatory-like domain-containing protein [Chloroflexi bacterium]|nr:carboxypeptidase regulatory-like domain-containing protein [Chloroflexota bacterium]MBP7043786.1 carboxypeptidase regulatory-like domain-containing protein [Chloroflexota bacterium]
MSYVNSPKIEYSPDGRPPERKDRRRQAVRIAIFIVLIISIGINIYAFRAANLINRVAGTDGIVQGVVVDDQGNPIAQAEISLAAAPEAQAITQADGTFTLANIPTGDQYLIVVSQGVGQGYVITIQTDNVTQLGTISYEAKPPVWN